VMDFPNDPNVADLSDEYLIGDHVLAAPIIVPEGSREPSGTAQIPRQRSIYLPAGEWYDFWTNERRSGGTVDQRKCPLDVMPLYVRAGTILPMGPEVQYATEKPGAPYEIRVYPGADADFVIYEDDSETYRYEKGARATIPLHWDDRRQILTIGRRQGGFPGMVARRTMRIVWARPGHGAGIAPVAQADAEVVYAGSAVQVRRSAR